MVVQGGAPAPEIVSYMSAMAALISDYKFSKYPAGCHFVIVMVKSGLTGDYSWLIITLPESWPGLGRTGLLYNS